MWVKARSGKQAHICGTGEEAASPQHQGGLQLVEC